MPIAYGKDVSITQRIRELEREGKSNNEIVQVLLDDGFTIQTRGKKWGDLPELEKRGILDKRVRQTRSKIKKQGKARTNEDLERQKLQLEIEKLEDEKRKRDQQEEIESMLQRQRWGRNFGPTTNGKSSESNP